MSLRIICRLLRRALLLYGMGALEGKGAARVERHLGQCAACREDFRGIVAQEWALRRAINETGPALFAAPAEENPSRNQRRRFGSRATVLLAAALLLAALLVGVGRCGLPHCQHTNPGTSCTCTVRCSCCGR